MSEKVDYNNIAHKLDKGVTAQWDRMLDEVRDLYMEHCENLKELEEFYLEICKVKNLGGLTTDLLETAYDRLRDEWFDQSEDDFTVLSPDENEK